MTRNQLSERKGEWKNAMTSVLVSLSPFSSLHCLEVNGQTILRERKRGIRTDSEFRILLIMQIESNGLAVYRETSRMTAHPAAPQPNEAKVCNRHLPNLLLIFKPAMLLIKAGPVFFNRIKKNTATNLVYTNISRWKRSTDSYQTYPTY